MLSKWETIEGEAFEKSFDAAWKLIAKEEEEERKAIEFIICCPEIFKDRPQDIQWAKDNYEYTRNP